MCANACRTYLLPRQGIKLVSWLYVVQAEITLTLLHSERPKLHRVLAFLNAIVLSKIFLVPVRPAKYESLIIGTGGMERDQVKNE